MTQFNFPELEFDLGRLHHVGVVVDDIEAATQYFGDVYGMTVRSFPESSYTCRIDGVVHSTTQRLAMTIDGPPHVELLRSVPNSIVWQRSSGVHHLGFVVADLVAASKELERRGSPLWMGGLHNGQCPAGAAYHRDPFGVTIELLDRATERGLAARLRGA